MHTFGRATGIAAMLAVLSACAPAAPPPPDPAADEAAFRAATVTWAEAFNAADADRLAALYAEDAVVMPPGTPAVNGRAAIREYLGKFAADARAANLTMTLAEDAGGIGVSGDLGWHSGSYAVKDAAGATVEAGKWVETWRRAGGEWHMVRDIWNTDAPAPAPAPAAAPAGAPAR